MTARQDELQRFIHHAEQQYLGAQCSAAFAADPKHLLFSIARYKFVARMLSAYPSILEVGCGDGFEATIVSQAVQRLTCVDIHDYSLTHRADNSWLRRNTRFVAHDIVVGPLEERFDAVYALDFIEHIPPEHEESALKHIVGSSTENGVLILGTPNVTANAFASHQSQVQHVNLKSYDSLRDTVLRWYTHVFMFGMNDEVVHTGYGPMCHYLFALGVGPRQTPGIASP